MLVQLLQAARVIREKKGTISCRAGRPQSRHRGMGVTIDPSSSSSSPSSPFARSKSRPVLRSGPGPGRRRARAVVPLLARRGPRGVDAAEEALGQRAQAGQAARDDARVELDDAPGRERHRVPQPVALLAVRAQVQDAHDGAGGHEAAQPQDEEQRHLGAPRHVDAPEHAERDHEREGEIGRDVEGEVDVRGDLDLLGGPAPGLDGEVPCVGREVGCQEPVER